MAAPFEEIVKDQFDSPEAWQEHALDESLSHIQPWSRLGFLITEVYDQYQLLGEFNEDMKRYIIQTMYDRTYKRLAIQRTLGRDSDYASAVDGAHIVTRGLIYIHFEDGDYEEEDVSGPYDWETDEDSEPEDASDDSEIEYFLEFADEIRALLDAEADLHFTEFAQPDSPPPLKTLRGKGLSLIKRLTSSIEQR